MKTILVPVDFSKSSKAALSLAVLVAKKMKAKIVMLTVINGSSFSNTLANWRKLETSMIRTAKKDAESLIKMVRRQKISIAYQPLLGFPVGDMIEEFTSRNKIDLIVMGTKGATGLKRAFIGSNAVSMIEKSGVPVMVVPEKSKPRGIKTLVFATDMKNLESEMEAIERLTQHLKAKIHVLHITRVNYSKLKQLQLENELMEYPHATLHITKSLDIIGSIEQFAKEHKADIIVLFTHTVGFYEKLLGKSITRQFAFKGTLPLLTFNRSNI